MPTPTPRYGVYFIEAPSCGLVKIGKAENVLSRFFGLADSSPVPLVFLADMQGYTAVERRVHELFDETRHHGEWFTKNDKLAALVANAANDWSIGAHLFPTALAEDLRRYPGRLIYRTPDVRRVGSLRRIVSTIAGFETLECGHTQPTLDGPDVKRRRCAGCMDEPVRPV
jgi:hypothetical protein